MSPSPLFRETRPDVLQELIRNHPFATLTTAAKGKITADHLPLIFHPDAAPNGLLRGHISAANPLGQLSEQCLDTLVIFQGPQSYVTPSWYVSKHVHGKVVPTWNYAIVHVSGRLRFTRDTAWLMDHLNDLTNAQETQRAVPWEVSDAPERFVARQLKALIGIEITIESITGIWKVSQNKSAEDRSGVAQGLDSARNQNTAEMADLIRSH